MAWTIEFEEAAKRELGKLDHQIQRQIVRYLETRVALAEDPEDFGTALLGEFVGLWRYRVGDYRILCRLEREQIIVFVISVGHRKSVYDR